MLEPFLHTLSVICRGAVPRYLAYEHVKVRVPGPGGRRQREHKMLIYCWRRELDFPDAPVFHAQPVNLDAPQSQYGALNVPPKSIFPEVRPVLNYSLQPCCFGKRRR